MSDKIETAQYNAALAITGAIRGPFKEEFHQDLVLKFLEDRRWLKPMSKLCEIVLSKLPPSFYEIIPPLQMSLGTLIVFKLYVVGLHFSKILFLSFTIIEWNKMDSEMKNIDSHIIFRKKLLTFIRPLQDATYVTYTSFKVGLLNRLHLGFSYLREQNFADALNLFCTCPFETENTEQYYLFYAVKITYHFVQQLQMI